VGLLEQFSVSSFFILELENKNNKISFSTKHKELKILQFEAANKKPETILLNTETKIYSLF